MNYVIVRSKYDLLPQKTVPIISFECSYGLENDNGNNGFSCKIAESEGIIELGGYLQLGVNNPNSIGYQYYKTAKTDWCGKILNRDIDKSTGVVTYTGVSLIGALNNFVPVRDTEELEIYNPTEIYNGDYYSSLSNIPDSVITNGFNAINLRFGSNIGFTPVRSRLYSLFNLAHFPIDVDRGRETTFRYGEKGDNFDSTRKTWDDRFSKYLDYSYGVDDRTFGNFLWRYATDGSVYTYEEEIPEGVSVYFEVWGFTSTVELRRNKGVMDSIQDGLLIDSEIRVSITGNTPHLFIDSRQPQTTDYIYIHDKLGMKLFDSLPYTAAASGLDPDDPDPRMTYLLRLQNRFLTTVYGYYDLIYVEQDIDNNSEIPYDSNCEYAYGGNLHMLKTEADVIENLLQQSTENIEKLSHEITLDKSADPDYVLQHEYIFLLPQEYPERLLSNSSPAGAHAMKMILKNKKIIADAYTHKVVYSFYPELSYERGQ